MSKEGSSFCFVSQVDSCIVEALCFVVDPWINACWAAQQIAHRLVCAVVPLQLYAIIDNGGTRHLTSSTSTSSSLLTSTDPDAYEEHNMWNLMMGLFCHEHVGAFMESYSGRIALSWHFAFDLLCDKAEVHCAEARYLANIAL